MTTSAQTPAPTAAVPSSFAAVVSTAFVSNPRRTRGLDAAMLTLPARPSVMVGNPRRTRGIDAGLLAG
ncbi:hypothetical protein ACVBEQ_18150 [Nakamurella sp. GG22]